MGEKTIQSFEELVVWQKSDVLWQMVCEDIKLFPPGKISQVVIDQLARSVGSVSANIAEGYGAGYTQELMHSLRIARKEVNESLNWLIKSNRLNFITEQRLGEYRGIIEEIMKMRNSLLSKLRQRNNE